MGAVRFRSTGVCSSGTNSLKPMRNRGCTWLGNYIIKPQHKGPKAGKPESFLSVVCGARPPSRVNSDCLKTCESFWVFNDVMVADNEICDSSMNSNDFQVKFREAWDGNLAYFARVRQLHGFQRRKHKLCESYWVFNDFMTMTMKYATVL